MALRLRSTKRRCRRSRIVRRDDSRLCAAADQVFAWLTATDLPLASVGSPSSSAPSWTRRRGEPAAAERCTITPSVFARSFVLPNARVVHAGHCRWDHASAFQAGRGRAEGVEAGGCPAPLGHHGKRPASRQAGPRNFDVVHRVRPEGRRGRWVRLGDFDWENEMLRVRCPKPGRTYSYPLSRGVGESILRYMREVRHPASDARFSSPCALRSGRSAAALRENRQRPPGSSRHVAGKRERMRCGMLPPSIF